MTLSDQCNHSLYNLGIPCCNGKTQYIPEQFTQKVLFKYCLKYKVSSLLIHNTHTALAWSPVSASSNNAFFMIHTYGKTAYGCSCTTHSYVWVRQGSSSPAFTGTGISHSSLDSISGMYMQVPSNRGLILTSIVIPSTFCEYCGL